MSCEIIGKADLCIIQRATFKTSLQLTDESGSALNISGWSFSGSIKESFDQTTPTTTFSCSITDLPNAVIEIALNPQSSALLNKKKYLYDIIATNIQPTPDEVYRIIEGKVLVDLAVTDL